MINGIEDYTYNSTYAFQENKLGSGIELEGLENVNWGEIRNGYNRTVQDFNNNVYSKVSNFLRGNPVTETLNVAQNTVTNVAQTAADVTGVSNTLGLENQTQQSIEGVVHTVQQFPTMSDDQKGVALAGL